MRIVSVQVGTPRTVGTARATDPMERAFTSAIWKSPVEGPVWAGELGLRGDAVANTRVHGGPEQAVLMYAEAHYQLWRTEWDRPELGAGAFGENLTVSGLTEETVCLGDVVVVGQAQLQVTRPREPCATLARRHQVSGLIAVVRANGRSGWYLRVLREGELAAGDPIALIDRPHPSWSVRRAGQVMQDRWHRAAEAAELAALSALSSGWRKRLATG
ncbi:MAG: MOSC domain-containing protein [Gemmatimonadales bacterium]|nr:MOSC domain-containing protein [Gemmatimonadales bacterium]